jgi:Fe2+ or Zn2+ uptake regulation protein
MERNTVQRQIILEELRKLNTHPTIEEVYFEIQKEHPSISKTTIYRNLRQFANEGIIKQVLMPDGLERYDKHNTLHHHFNCKKCNSIFDVEIDYLSKINNKINETIEDKYGYDVERHDVIFTGICQECKNKENEKKSG